jgi:hypothetical protein
MWDLWWKVALGPFCLSTAVFPVNSHFADYSTLINYRPELVQQAK